MKDLFRALFVYLLWIFFSSNIKAAGVSAATGEGIPELFEHIDAARIDFQETYLPDLLR